MIVNFHELTSYPMVYLATPYTKYAKGLDAAWKDACSVAARLLIEGVRVYSPIAHCHGLAIHGNPTILPSAHSIWLPFDEAMMLLTDCLLVAKLDGWDKSKGVTHEIEFFQKRGRPIYYIEPQTLVVSDAA